MKKVFLLALLLISTVGFSQRIMEGDTELNVGIGFSSGGWSIPIYGGIDYGVTDDISVGGMVSFSSQDYAYEAGKFKGKWMSIGANGNYHFNTLLNIPDEFDVYAGLTLAYNSFSYDYPNDYAIRYKGSGIGLAAQIGGRYFFSENIGVNLEFGGGDIASGGKAGITIRF
ncbi:MAG: outer membrane beta-barrel protein [Flavobacteriaceae bacterium]|nr:outer membrane beta-barrel protein [Flavobacteriaceae bacterium]MCB0474159.1 outer membrane beta-barrel protein [Flavobacteriaceae bacterium]